MTTTNANFCILITGAIIAISSLLADSLGNLTSGIGFIQLAGFTIGTLIALLGLRRIHTPEQPHWDWLFVGIYLSGIYFAGFYKSNFSQEHNNHFLGESAFGLQDFSINLIGFIPFAFILAGALSHSKTEKSTFIIAVLAGVLVSLSIEYLQYYYTTNRYSSVYDIIANSVGMLVGASLFYLVNNELLMLKIFKRKNNTS